MIQISRANEIIAEMSFKNKIYDIKYLKEDFDVKTWFTLYRNAEYFDAKIGSAMPYASESDIYDHKHNLEIKGYTFKIID